MSIRTVYVVTQYDGRTRCVFDRQADAWAWVVNEVETLGLPPEYEDDYMVTPAEYHS